METKAKKSKSTGKITQVQAVTSSALAVIISMMPPECLDDYLSAAETMFRKAPFSKAQSSAYNEAIASACRLMEASNFKYEDSDGIVVAMLTAQALATLREREVI